MADFSYTSNLKITATKTVSKDYAQVLLEPKWRDDAAHFVVNVENPINESLKNPEALARTLADNIHFIQWGSDDNKASAEDFIAKNDNNGAFYSGQISGSFTAEIGEDATVKWQPEVGYAVYKVYVNGKEVSYDSNYLVIEKVDQDVLVEVVFINEKDIQPSEDIGPVNTSDETQVILYFILLLPLIMMMIHMLLEHSIRDTEKSIK